MFFNWGSFAQLCEVHSNTSEVSKPAGHLHDQAAVEYFECRHASLRGSVLSHSTATSSAQCIPRHVSIVAKLLGAKAKPRNTRAATSSKSKLIERCGIPGDKLLRLSAARREIQQLGSTAVQSSVSWWFLGVRVQRSALSNR